MKRLMTELLIILATQQLLWGQRKMLIEFFI